MNIKKNISGLLFICTALGVNAQHTFLGKRLVVDVNAASSTQAFRIFDTEKQFLQFGDDELLGWGKSDAYKFWKCNHFFSADAEVILWKKGSIMLEGRTMLYSKYKFYTELEEKQPSYTYTDHTRRQGKQRSFEAGIGYRQYLFNTSNVPYGRYIQIGVNRAQVQWKHDCLAQSVIEENKVNKTFYNDNIKHEKKAGYDDMWAPYLELGYNHLFFNDKLRVSFGMRSEFPIGYDKEVKDNKNDVTNDSYYAMRHFWSSNFLSLRAGIGWVIF